MYHDRPVGYKVDGDVPRGTSAVIGTDGATGKREVVPFAGEGGPGFFSGSTRCESLAQPSEKPQGGLSRWLLEPIGSEETTPTSTGAPASAGSLREGEEIAACRLVALACEIGKGLNIGGKTALFFRARVVVRFDPSSERNHSTQAGNTDVSRPAEKRTQ